MQNQVSKIQSLNKLYWFYLIGFFLILALPLLVVPPWFTPIPWGKTIVFRIIFSILTFFFIWQILFKKIDVFYLKNKIKSLSFLFWLLVSLFGIYLLATIFSLDAHFSFWGDPVRSGGFLNFSFYIFFSILTFLVIRAKDWQKIWDFSIFIGILVSFVAIFQQFGVFSETLISFTFRPVSTLGNAILLAIYLLLLIFLTLSFAIKAKNRLRKIFYFSSFLLFVFVLIFLSQTRAAFVGLAIGSFWFLFAYPKKMKLFKISAGIFLILAIFGMFFLNSHFDILKNQPLIIRSTIGRVLSVLTEIPKITESRISSWKISWEALKERPILGYGPENFMIAFDKHYDPSLPKIGYDSSGQTPVEWWDRAHNFVFDISVTAGIPALIIYLLLFSVLLWQLQKTKRKRPKTAVICHGIQATFIGYLTTLFFSFDTFSTYLISFLIIGYSFYLISDFDTKNGDSFLRRGIIESFVQKLYKYNQIIIFVLFVFLVWFIWSFNLKPLQATKDLTLALDYSQKRKCEQALKIVDDIVNSKNIIDTHIRRMSAAVIIRDCTDEIIKPPIESIEYGASLLKKNTEKDSNYLRDWLLLAEYTNILVEEKIKYTDNVFIPTEEMEILKDEVNYYFERASLLSPRRQEVYKEWLKIDLITGEYEKAKEKAQKCINLNPNYGVCHWLMALSQGYSGDFEKFDYFAKIAKAKNYNIESKEALHQSINMYIKTENYKGLAEIYPKLISIASDNKEKAQLYAPLAVVYKELGEIEKAREQALKALELMPEAKAIVEEFLKSLEGLE